MRQGWRLSYLYHRLFGSYEQQKTRRVRTCTDAVAAFAGQKSQGGVHDIEVGAADDFAPVFLLNNEARVHQRSQVMGKGRGRETHMLLYLADRQTVAPGPHQQPEHRQPGFVAERGKGGGHIFLLCFVAHAVKYNHETSFVKAFSR